MPAEYVAIMNCIFAAQKKVTVLDSNCTPSFCVLVSSVFPMWIPWGRPQHSCQNDGVLYVASSSLHPIHLSFIYLISLWESPRPFPSVFAKFKWSKIQLVNKTRKNICWHNYFLHLPRIFPSTPASYGKTQDSCNRFEVCGTFSIHIRVYLLLFVIYSVCRLQTSLVQFISKFQSLRDCYSFCW